MKRILLFPWKNGINTYKTQKQQDKGKAAADPHDMLCSMCEKWQKMHDCLADRVAKHQNDQGCNTGKDEDDCVYGADQASYHIVSWVFTGIDPIQAAFDTHDSDGGRPQRGNRSDGKYRFRRADVKIVDDTYYDRMDRLRCDTDQKIQKIGLSDGWNKLKQGQKQHQKRKCGYDDKKRCLGSVYRSFSLCIFLIDVVKVTNQGK